jgi:hypothetical protein
MDVLGTRKDWSTWSGAEIAGKIFNFLDNKIKRCSFPELETSHSSSSSGKMSDFFNPVPPPISLDEYIKRIVHYTRISVSPVNLAIALLYIERIEHRKLCEVNEFTVFRLFLTAYLIAFKRFDDPPVMKNKDYSKIAGVSLRETNCLELSFLKALDFDLGIGEDEAFCREITRYLVPSKESTSTPSVIFGDAAIATVAGITRWTPDSVAKIEEAYGESEEQEYFKSSCDNRGRDQDGSIVAASEDRQLFDYDYYYSTHWAHFES